MIDLNTLIPADSDFFLHAALESPSLPLAPTVRMQLHRSDGGPCWDATFSTPTVNTTLEFTAKSD